MNRTKQTHTPGPWMQDEDEYDRIYGHGGEDVAQVTRSETGPRGITYAQGKANARLIAEAPAMREALAELVMVARLHKLDTLAAVVNARAILARIEGGEA